MTPQDLSRKFTIILASGSPRRQMLLKHLGLEFRVEVRETDEQFPLNLTGADIPGFLCRKKADAFNGSLSEKDLLITADTIVWINGRVLNKPAGEEEAIDMLTILSGSRHEVYTGVCLRTLDKELSFVVRSDVYFKQLSREEIADYVRHFRPFDKAGSYGAQEFLPAGKNACSLEEIRFISSLGADALMHDCYPKVPENSLAGIERIEGSYFNVMGFPVVEFWDKVSSFLLPVSS